MRRNANHKAKSKSPFKVSPLRQIVVKPYNLEGLESLMKSLFNYDRKSKGVQVDFEESLPKLVKLSHNSHYKKVEKFDPDRLIAKYG